MSSLLLLLLVCYFQNVYATSSAEYQLDLMILSAQNVPDMDDFSASDPFIIVSNSVKGVICTTNFIQDNDNPVWNYLCSLGTTITQGQSLSFTLSLYDADVLFNDFIGNATWVASVPDVPELNAWSDSFNVYTGACAITLQYRLGNVCGQGPYTDPQCTNPPGTDCSFYTNCMEEIIPCGSTGYALGFGMKYCGNYQEAYPYFSPTGQDWVNYVRKCLQQALVPTLMTCPSTTTCPELLDIAFDSHPGCYLNGPISVCDLVLTPDFFPIVYSIFSSLGKTKSWTQIAPVVTSCAKDHLFMARLTLFVAEPALVSTYLISSSIANFLSVHNSQVNIFSVISGSNSGSKRDGSGQLAYYDVGISDITNDTVATNYSSGGSSTYLNISASAAGQRLIANIGKVTFPSGVKAMSASSCDGFCDANSLAPTPTAAAGPNSEGVSLTPGVTILIAMVMIVVVEFGR